jgi:Prokaryotic Cytochrome C oxidase subunit IV
MSVRDVRRLDTQTGVWLILLGATVLAAVLGLEQAGASPAVGLVLLAVAFVKLRLVGLYFMELMTAPLPLRLLFEGYVAGVFIVLAGLYIGL